MLSGIRSRWLFDPGGHILDVVALACQGLLHCLLVLHLLDFAARRGVILVLPRSLTRGLSLAAGTSQGAAVILKIQRLLSSFDFLYVELLCPLLAMFMPVYKAQLLFIWILILTRLQ